MTVAYLNNFIIQRTKIQNYVIIGYVEHARAKTISMPTILVTNNVFVINTIFVTCVLMYKYNLFIYCINYLCTYNVVLDCYVQGCKKKKTRF